MTDNELYFFDDKQRLMKIEGGVGSLPGRFPKVCVSIVPTPDDNIVATDFLRRLNVWNSDGELVRSLVLPDLSAMPNATCLYKDKLIVAGKFFNSEDGSLGVRVYDPLKKTYTSVLHATDIGSQSLVGRKDVAAVSRAFFFWSDEHMLFCNTSTSMSVIAVDMNTGVTRRNDKLPPNVVPLSRAPDVDSKQVFKAWNNAESPFERDSIFCEWQKTWSWSASPSVYSDTILIIRRNCVAPFYLDFYSTKDIQYIGQCTTDKPFMCSDSKWIYLCEDFNDTALVVGKYRVKFEELSFPERKIVYYRKPPKDLAERAKRAMTRSRQSPANVNKAFITLPGGDSVNLLARLPETYNHILLFLSPFDCGVLELITQVKRFVRERGTYDFHFVVTHAAPQDLEDFAQGVESFYGVPGLLNIDKTKLADLGVHVRPTLQAIDRDGNVLGMYSPIRNTEPLRAFLSRLPEY